MLGSQPIIGFVPTLDPARARSFYEDVLGLRLVRDDGFALVFSAGERMVRVVTVSPDHRPLPFTILGWDVPDVRAIAAALRERGVQCERYPGMSQDELGVWVAPGGDEVAWFKDPDGNVLSLTKHVA